MAGESQETPSTGIPDPSVLTTEQMLRAIYNLEKLARTAQEGDHRLVLEKISAIRAELHLREEHRKELKSDAEKALTTAREADQKAVQAALAAAEKARDQQTIASQLATNKAEVAFVDALKQQQTTFTLAIENVVQGLNEAKIEIREQRAEKRGGKDLVNAIYAFAGFLAVLVIVVGAFVTFK